MKPVTPYPQLLLTGAYFSLSMLIAGKQVFIYHNMGIMQISAGIM